jgi:hypothetical protein
MDLSRNSDYGIIYTKVTMDNQIGYVKAICDSGGEEIPVNIVKKSSAVHFQGV